MAAHEKLGRLPAIALVAFLWLLIWEGASLALGSSLLLPGPRVVLLALISQAQETDFWQSIGFSIGRIVLGFFGGVLTALVVSIASELSHRIKSFIGPVVHILKTVPVASFIVLVLVWVNAQDLALVISYLMAFPIMVINLNKGFQSVDARVLELARIYKVSRETRFKTIYLASVFPYFQAGLSLALGLCWKAGIAAEVIALPAQSIGSHLFDAKVYLDTPKLFAWTIVIVLLSFTFEHAIKALLLWWRRRWERSLW